MPWKEHRALKMMSWYLFYVYVQMEITEVTHTMGRMCLENVD